MPSFLPTVEPVAIITASYISSSSFKEISLPSSTLPTNLKPSWVAIFSNTLETLLIFG